MPKAPNRSHFLTSATAKTHCRCSAIAFDAPSYFSDVSGIRWGSTSLQGPREEMEDDFGDPIGRSRWILLRSCFCGHAGFSSVKFLRLGLNEEIPFANYFLSLFVFTNCTSSCFE
ncbi:hypothetical protein SLEP1_g3258 [Rubroshorea leprosula]|uniref:Uncharacterized protein n=1 Tax=Rubroshorea leprosula TaxID=152421 RepID=A0AAV5HR89_9ROSI|nr:hypothetical protein SLEP1_g3258 [Rubroshorea leprosula]